jgi:hypothetical protein
MRLDSLRLWRDCFLPSLYLRAVLSHTFVTLCHTLCRRTGSGTLHISSGAHSRFPAGALIPPPSCRQLCVAADCTCASCNATLVPKQGHTLPAAAATAGAHALTALPLFPACLCTADHKAPYHRTAASSGHAVLPRAQVPRTPPALCQSEDWKACFLKQMGHHCFGELLLQPSAGPVKGKLWYVIGETYHVRNMLLPTRVLSRHVALYSACWRHPAADGACT